MKLHFILLAIITTFNINSENIFKIDSKNYKKSLLIEQSFSDSDFVFKEYNPLPWTELERNPSNFIPLISNQTINFTQNGTATILQERIIQHIYTNIKTNTEVIKQTTKEQQTITEPIIRSIVVSKTNTLETENKSHCTEWTPDTNTKFVNETLKQNQECDVQTIDTYSYSFNGNIMEQKNINGNIKKNYTRNVSGSKQIAKNSCKEILDAGHSVGNGEYPLNVNGTVKNFFCDMNGGGWTLYDEYDSQYVARQPYNLTINDKNDLQNAGYSSYFDYFYNNYHGCENCIVLNNGYKMFFQCDLPQGYIEFKVNKNAEVRVVYGNPFMHGSCNLYVNNNLARSIHPYNNDIYVYNANSNDTIKIQENGICSIDSVWFK